MLGVLLLVAIMIIGLISTPAVCAFGDGAALIGDIVNFRALKPK